MQTSDRPQVSSTFAIARSASVSRKTGETDFQVTVNLDGTGRCVAKTGIPYITIVEIVLIVEVKTLTNWT